MQSHRSDVARMGIARDRVLALNKTTLSYEGPRVIFLTRRDRLGRTISDLMGQQTGLWGPTTCDGLAHLGVDEAAVYRREIRRKRLAPIDVELVEWYLHQGCEMERGLRKSVPDARCFDLTYESIFAPEVSMAERLERYLAVVEFLGYDTDEAYWQRPIVEWALSPRRKLNSPSTHALIPNAVDLRQRFGWD